MSIDTLANRREYSVVNSLYSDASEVGGAPPCDEANTNLRPSTRATSASVCEVGDLRAGHGVVLQGLTVAGGPGFTYSVSRSRRWAMGE